MVGDYLLSIIALRVSINNIYRIIGVYRYQGLPPTGTGTQHRARAPEPGGGGAFFKIIIKVKNHFSELLPWACWCYGLHPLLWHTMGHLQSESGVQQGDPLGPLLFDLVLNLVISEISEDEVCSNLQFHA